MCGLVGLVSRKQQENTLESMLEVLAYRGPDDSGTFVEAIGKQFVHLGQNRLSIQDTSKKGHQPFISDCGNYILVFNGEVYNFKSIKSELEALGQHFKSGSDTEVILYAYIHWGINCLEKFVGMFAFSILDIKQKKITVVRDRAGVKPLYYYANDEEFAFSSELKSFHHLPLFEKKLNKTILPYYFQFGYIPAPHTIFEKTHKLLPGHYLEYDLKKNGIQIRKYWDVEEHYHKEKFDCGEAKIITDLEDLLFDAVNLRMVSDVPVGVFLSGGFDSSLVTSILSQNTNQKLNTFTIGFNDKQYNEANHAKEVSKYFNTHHKEYYVSNKDMLDKVEKLPIHFDEPFGAGSAIPTMILSELASNDVKVVLSADGGDEAFCGYSKYFALKKIEKSFNPKIKKQLIQSFLKLTNTKLVKNINNILPAKYQRANIEDKYVKFKRAYNSKNLQDMFYNASSSVSSEDIKSIIKVNFNSQLYNNFKMRENLSFLDNMMLIDYKNFMVDEVLTKVDRSTMSASIEGREPLIDHRIIEFMARVPEEIKYKNNQGKYLLRKILYKYIPQKLIDKPKSGFHVPMSQWLRGDLKQLVDKHLSSSQLDPEIFNIAELKKHYQVFLLGDDSKANSVWFILMFQMWREQWEV